MGTFVKVTSVTIFIVQITKYMYSMFSSLSAVEGSNLYKRFQEERDHILKNKWFMSEREGKDVGFERALLDWVFNHRSKWFK